MGCDFYSFLPKSGYSNLTNICSLKPLCHYHSYWKNLGQEEKLDWKKKIINFKGKLTDTCASHIKISSKYKSLTELGFHFKTHQVLSEGKLSKYLYELHGIMNC